MKQNCRKIYRKLFTFLCIVKNKIKLYELQFAINKSTNNIELYFYPQSIFYYLINTRHFKYNDGVECTI